MTHPGSVAEQLNLFDSVSLDPTARLKEAMRTAERNAKQNQNLSRDQIVDRMGELEKSEGLVSNGRSGITTKEHWAKLEHARRDMKRKQKLIEGQIKL